MKAFRGGETKIMNKKFIAIITALALVVTLLAPVGVQEASAKSDNSVDRVVTVKDDVYLSGSTAPRLIIENDDSFNWSDDQIFRLQLPSDVDWNLTNADLAAIYTGAPGAVTVTINSVISDQVIELKASGTWTSGGIISIPLFVDLDGPDAGELKVTVDGRDSRVSSGSYTFAVVSSGDTVATVGAKKSIKRTNAESGARIVIDETTVGAIGQNSSFRLRLPSNFEWNPTTAVSVTGTGLAANGTVNSNPRYLDVKVDFTGSDTVRRSIVIDPVINVTRDAKFGDVSVDITNTSGDISSQSGLLIAEYEDYGVDIQVEEVKEILAGYDDDTDEFKTATITIEETVSSSIGSGRVIDFALPSWVRIATGQDIEITNKTSGSSSVTPSYDKDRNQFDLSVDEIRGGSNTNKIKLELEIPLTIQGTKTGDIELEVKGAGIDAQTVVIAKAVAPITAEVEIKDVRLGVQNQAVADIILTETREGAIREDGRLELKFASGMTENFRFDKATFEVIEGDLVLDGNNHSTSGSALAIGIEDESTVPSKIKVSGVEITVNRTAPEGSIKLDITGKAIVNNNGNPGDFPNRVARFDFANVITPASSETRSTSVFNIDSMDYTVIESGQEVERTMDVAPYIKDSRTFLPVFFVAQSLGVSENNIIWEPNTKSVTVIKGNRIAQMQIGSKVLTVNGTAIQMDTAPEIKDGRTMLPIYYVGQALGASVEWDADARSVTVNN